MLKVRGKANILNARYAATNLIKKFAITKPAEIVLEDIAMAVGVLVIEDNLCAFGKCA